MFQFLAPMAKMFSTMSTAKSVADTAGGKDSLLEKGGGIMEGLSKIGGMFGGGGKEPVEMTPIDTSAPQLSGFDLDQYDMGGVPNDGKPAGIYDLRSGKTTGTMNEEAPELIVPAFSGRGGASIVDERVKTGDVKVVPETGKEGMDMGLFGSPTSPQGMQDTSADEFKPYTTALGGGKGQEGQGEFQDDTTKMEKKDKSETKKGLVPDSGTDFGDILKGMGRMAGYYYDMRRNRYGLGKSALTMWLDNMEKGEKKEEKPTETKMSEEDKMAKKHGYTMAEIGARRKGDKAKDLRKEEIKVREEASEDWDSLDVDEKEKYGEGAEGKKNYINDRIKMALEAKRPEYEEKEVDVEKRKWYGKKYTEKEKQQQRTGEYIPTENAQTGKDSGKDTGYTTWLQSQPRGKYKTPEEARKAYQAQGG